MKRGAWFSFLLLVLGLLACQGDVLGPSETMDDIVGDWRVADLSLMDKVTTEWGFYLSRSKIKPPAVSGNVTFGNMQPDNTGSVSFQYTYDGETVFLTGTYYWGPGLKFGTSISAYEIEWENNSTTLWSCQLYENGNLSLGMDARQVVWPRYIFHCNPE
jgi:hypothetical protein